MGIKFLWNLEVQKNKDYFRFRSILDHPDWNVGLPSSLI